MMNRKGFALVLVTNFLVVLLTLFIAVYFSLSLIKIEAQLTHLCRQKNLENLHQIQFFLKNLLNLNPQARALRWARAQALFDISQASASINPIALSEATARLRKIKKWQRILDRKQKSLIKNANQVSHIRANETSAKLFQTLFQIEKTLKNSFKIRTFLDVTKIPKLSVIPDNKDLAPIYETVPEFSDIQSMEHKWHYEIGVPSPLNRFFNQTTLVKSGCGATLTRENNDWIPVLKKVR